MNRFFAFTHTLAFVILALLTSPASASSCDVQVQFFIYPEQVYGSSSVPAGLRPVSVNLYGSAAEEFELGKSLEYLRNNPAEWGTTQHLWRESSAWKGSKTSPPRAGYDRPDGCATTVVTRPPVIPGGGGVGGGGGGPRCDCTVGGRPAYEGFGIGAVDWRTRVCSTSTPSFACTP